MQIESATCDKMCIILEALYICKYPDCGFIQAKIASIQL